MAADYASVSQQLGPEDKALPVSFMGPGDLPGGDIRSAAFGIAVPLPQGIAPLGWLSRLEPRNGVPDGFLERPDGCPCDR